MTNTRWPRDDKLFVGLVLMSLLLCVAVPLGLSDFGPKFFNEFVKQIPPKLPRILCGCD